MKLGMLQMALGNPLGKLQTGQAQGQYAWWYQQPGKNASSPLYVKDVDAQSILKRAQNSLAGGKQGVANTIVDHALAHGYCRKSPPSWQPRSVSPG